MIRTGHEEGREEENTWPDFQPGDTNINLPYKHYNPHVKDVINPLGRQHVKYVAYRWI